MTEVEVRECPTCGSHLNKTWHRVTPGIIKALIKFKKAVIAKGPEYQRHGGPVHTRRDMDGTPNELTKGEYANWTMLRYHGLVAKSEVSGKGYWILTRRGNMFLKGEISIPRRVQTMNNEVIDHSEVHVCIEDVMKGDVPHFEEIETIERERVPLELNQASLFG